MRLVATFRDANRLVKVFYSTGYEEYSCVPFVDGKKVEPATYYTDDKSDALDTALAMAHNVIGE